MGYTLLCIYAKYLWTFLFSFFSTLFDRIKIFFGWRKIWVFLFTYFHFCFFLFWAFSTFPLLLFDFPMREKLGMRKYFSQFTCRFYFFLSSSGRKAGNVWRIPAILQCHWYDSLLFAGFIAHFSVGSWCALFFLSLSLSNFRTRRDAN